MALYGRYQRVALTFLLWGFSFVHSSLIDYSCQNWEGYGKFLDVTFGDQPSLSKASCDQDVELETFSDSPPRIRYSQAVRILIKLHGCLKLIAELERGGTSSLNKSNIAKSYWNRMAQLYVLYNLYQKSSTWKIIICIMHLTMLIEKSSTSPTRGAIESVTNVCITFWCLL